MELFIPLTIAAAPNASSSPPCSQPACSDPTPSARPANPAALLKTTAASPKRGSEPDLLSRPEVSPPTALSFPAVQHHAHGLFDRCRPQRSCPLQLSRSRTGECERLCIPLKPKIGLGWATLHARCWDSQRSLRLSVPTDLRQREQEPSIPFIVKNCATEVIRGQTLKASAVA